MGLDSFGKPARQNTKANKVSILSQVLQPDESDSQETSKADRSPHDSQEGKRTIATKEMLIAADSNSFPALDFVIAKTEAQEILDSWNDAEEHLNTQPSKKMSYRDAALAGANSFQANRNSREITAKKGTWQEFQWSVDSDSDVSDAGSIAAPDGWGDWQGPTEDEVWESCSHEYTSLEDHCSANEAAGSMPEHEQSQEFSGTRSPSRHDSCFQISTESQIQQVDKQIPDNDQESTREWIPGVEWLNKVCFDLLQRRLLLRPSVIHQCSESRVVSTVVLLRVLRCE